MSSKTKIVYVPAGRSFKIFYDGVKFTITSAYGGTISSGILDGTILGYRKLVIRSAKE